MAHYIFLLLDRHQKLDAALRGEQRQKRPDQSRLQRLKRLKLAVRERLNKMARGDRLITSG